MRCQGDGCIRPAGAGGVCDECWIRRSVLLRDIPELWVRLHGELEKGGQGLAEGLCRPRPGSRPPLVVSVLDLLALVPRRLAGWAYQIEPIEWYQGEAWGRLLMTAVRTLRAGDEVLRGSPAAYRYLGTLAYLHLRMTRAVSDSARIRKLDAPCMACGQRQLPLYHDSDTATVTCTSCCHVAAYDTWAQWLLPG